VESELDADFCTFLTAQSSETCSELYHVYTVGQRLCCPGRGRLESELGEPGLVRGEGRQGAGWPETNSGQ
jgi:hypothetical protein